MMNVEIVLGAQFGDEGKGLVTSYLARKAKYEDKNPLVIRFNGGHQAGHTVVLPELMNVGTYDPDTLKKLTGVRHVFSSWGSGTLDGIPTYWSGYCTVNPRTIMNEYRVLRSKVPDGYRLGMLIIDPMCPVTTPYDVYYNRQEEEKNQHGSCGVGFGATIERHEDSPYKFFARDLSFGKAYIEHRLKAIREYYEKKGMRQWPTHEMIDSWVGEVTEMAMNSDIAIHSLPEITSHFNHFVFEGAQGILLDKDHGYFPHVTRSKTVSMNALSIMRFIRAFSPPVIYLVSRAYQTRHGNGPMDNEKFPSISFPIGKETNVSNTHQGDFRIGTLSADSLRRAVKIENIYSSGIKKIPVFTCMDQLLDVNKWEYFDGLNPLETFLGIPPSIGLDMSETLYSFADDGTKFGTYDELIKQGVIPSVEEVNNESETV